MHHGSGEAKYTISIISTHSADSTTNFPDSNRIITFNDTHPTHNTKQIVVYNNYQLKNASNVFSVAVFPPSIAIQFANIDVELYQM